MPAFGTLQHTMPSVSISFFDPGSANFILSTVPRTGGPLVRIAMPPRLKLSDSAAVIVLADAVRHRHAHHHARAVAPVEGLGKQVRRNRRQDVLDRAVFVEVAGHAERRQLAHFVDARHVPLKTRIGSCPSSSLRIRLHQLDARRVRHPQIEHDQIELVEVGADVREQLRHAILTIMARWPAASSAALNRSRTNGVSAATSTVLRVRS